MNDIKVSVIVLTFNHEKYIRQALDSILMQKVDFSYEILVGDDASNDATVKILEEYRLRFPEIVKLFVNKNSLGATRNTYNLLLKAQGKYLATCEGDDFWTDENKLQIQVDFLENNPEYVGCTHKFVIVDENGGKKRKQSLPWVKQKKIFTINDFDGIQMPGQPSTFVKKNLVSEINTKLLYEVHSMIGDRTMMLLYLMKGKFALLDKNMSCYRVSKNSLTRTIYSNHMASIKEDYNITLKLERIAFDGKRNIDTSNFKKALFAKSIILFIIKRNFNYLYFAKQIAGDNKFKYIISTPNYFFNYLRRFFI